MWTPLLHAFNSLSWLDPLSQKMTFRFLSQIGTHKLEVVYCTLCLMQRILIQAYSSLTVRCIIPHSDLSFVSFYLVPVFRRPTGPSQNPKPQSRLGLREAEVVAVASIQVANAIAVVLYSRDHPNRTVRPGSMTKPSTKR